MFSYVNSTLLPNNCKDAQLLSESVFYRLMIVLKGSGNIVAVAVFIILAIRKRQTRIYHPNTRIIALITCLFMFLMALQSASFYIFETWRISFPYTNPCDRLWPTPILFSLRSINGIFLMGVNSSIIILCIERVVCVCRISNYEQSSKPALVAVILLSTTTLFSVILVLLCIPGVDWDERLAVTTIRSTSNTATFQIMLFYMLVTQCLGVIFFLFLHFWSQCYRKRIRGAKLSRNRCNMLFIATDQSLSVKFQIEETIEMTRLFLPVVSVHCALSILNYGTALIVNMIWPIHSIPIDRQMILYELAYLSRLSPFFTSLLLARGTGQLEKMFCCSNEQKTNVSIIVNSNKDQDDYFNRLKQMFESSAMAHRRNKH
ncbi:serpentine type 7TM GPCR receptor class ab chemoreceptor domain-containing protein [Ditylenchus destructor]|uniref:Serpentine type 7TM GPCR receptor class ab chemoreceptor domain-containing protein n=1 Tax=Ditylenchus destructor TaxID=166010 RepID=A0AAD4MHQ3_9BILA|nr:serpentine type 7TM GPCR receptor class ab chemoreceptor domain-containing protein [Ditylenchus destructor]